MKAVETKTNNEAEITALTDHWKKALAEKNIDGMLENYAEDVVVFDVPPPLQIKGRDALRENNENWLKMFEGPVAAEFKDVSITASDDLAVLHQLARIYDKNKGPESGSWARVTVCYRKTDGKWLAFHDHVSVPISVGGN
jgi:uncharacterized protein (TIGR02246 family)